MLRTRPYALCPRWLNALTARDTMMSAPMATSWKYGFTWSMFSALEMIPVRSTPKNVPMILPRAARHRRAADDHGADGLQLDPASGGGLGCADAGQKERRRDADEQPVDDEEGQPAPVDRDAREIGGLDIAADGEGPAADLCVFENEVDDEEARETDDEHERDDIEEPLRPEELEVSVDQLQDALGEGQRDAAKNPDAGQRDDERRRLEQDRARPDEEGVECRDKNPAATESEGS